MLFSKAFFCSFILKSKLIRIQFFIIIITDKLSLIIYNTTLERFITFSILYKKSKYTPFYLKPFKSDGNVPFANNGKVLFTRFFLIALRLIRRSIIIKISISFFIIFITDNKL